MPTKTKIMLGLGAVGFLCLGLLGGMLLAAKLDPPKSYRADSTAKTAPKTVVIAGDISCIPGMATSTLACRSAETATLISSLRPDAVLATGDLQYQVGALSAFQESYDKTWGAFKDITYPVPGNHEYATPEAAGYYDYFGERAGEKGKGYYTYKIGDWQIIALNSEVDISAKSNQLFWLQQVLDTYKSPCTLAYWHKPRFSTGGHPNDATYDAVWRLLYSHGVDIVANGHSHGYERFAPQDPDGKLDTEKGIVQFVSGMGGRSSQNLAEPVPNLATRQNHTFGVLKLSLYPNAAHYEFVPIPGQQTFSDRGTIACH